MKVLGPASTLARSSSAAVLAVVLMSAAGCSLLDRGTAEEGSAKGGAPGASRSGVGRLPAGAQKPLDGHLPLVHLTSETGGARHEFETAGGFLVRFACRGSGQATVAVSARTYTFTCSAGASEQQAEYTAPDGAVHTYDLRVKTAPKNAWSMFLDQRRVR